jgi:hypothetical protein
MCILINTCVHALDDYDNRIVSIVCCNSRGKLDSLELFLQVLERIILHTNCATAVHTMIGFFKNGKYIVLNTSIIEVVLCNWKE